MSGKSWIDVTHMNQNVEKNDGLTVDILNLTPLTWNELLVRKQYINLRYP